MFFGIVTLIAALLLAAVSGWFSIAGMMVIFSGMKTAGIATGLAVEFGKLMGISWLYRNWNDGVWFRHLMLIVTMIAIFVTSIGVYGFLSKAHHDQTAPVSNNTARIEMIQQQIVSEKEKITHNEKILESLDEQVAALVSANKINDSGKKKGSITVRKEQQTERDILQQEINNSRTLVSKYQEETLMLSQALRDFEVEVGPVKYIADLLYPEDNRGLEKSIIFVIVMVMLCLDPMAIMLLMGANHIFLKNEKKNSITEDIIPEELIEDEIENDPITAGDIFKDLDATIEASKPEDKMVPEEYFNEHYLTPCDFDFLKNGNQEDSTDVNRPNVIEEQKTENENTTVTPPTISIQSSRYGSRRVNSSATEIAKHASPEWINTITKRNRDE
jgi:hypothetical protein